MKRDELLIEFEKRFGKGEHEIRFFFAPGRVNLIGEHTDYNGGYVLPATLELKSAVAVRRRDDFTVRIQATDIPDQVNGDINNIEACRNLKWGNYQAGVIEQLLKGGVKLTGCDMLFDLDLPISAGLSSSAAIEVSTAIAMLCVCTNDELKPEDLDMSEIARLCQRAENEFVGVKCGILDQFASANGKRDTAIFLNCKDLNYEYVPLVMPEYKIVISNTNVKRSLATTKYNERRQECEDGFAILKEFLPERETLGDVTMQDFAEFESKIGSDTIRKRLLHVVSEDERVKKAAEALKQNNIAEFGKLMIESHRSLRNNYEVTGDELDTLVEEALKISGVAGSRMTGAGFGGCTVSIVRNEAVDHFIDTVGKKYYERIGLNADFYITRPGSGAGEWEEES